jgi:hypothetical protein
MFSNLEQRKKAESKVYGNEQLSKSIRKQVLTETDFLGILMIIRLLSKCIS